MACPRWGWWIATRVAGAVQFYKQARAAGIHPVIGSEVTLEGGGTLVLLVENAEGYRNLCRLLTTRIEHPGGVTLDDLHRFRAGLICLCGTARPEYREIYGRNFALAISPGDRRWPPRDAACASRWWPPPTRTTARPRTACSTTSWPPCARSPCSARRIRKSTGRGTIICTHRKK